MLGEFISLPLTSMYKLNCITDARLIKPTLIAIHHHKLFADGIGNCPSPNLHSLSPIDQHWIVPQAIHTGQLPGTSSVSVAKSEVLSLIFTCSTYYHPARSLCHLPQYEPGTGTEWQIVWTLEGLCDYNEQDDVVESLTAPVATTKDDIHTCIQHTYVNCYRPGVLPQLL